ncbi:MAG TPA: phosphate ABC transporter substrate-binding protein PstS [Gallionellaceae bacterium]|nr:phosphate ABC transporter substrate-binding protein PstS [Gallionellaceae bacterium]
MKLSPWVRMCLSVIVLASSFNPAFAEAVKPINGSGSQPLSRLYVQWSESYQARRGVPASYRITNVVVGMQELEAGKSDYAGTEIPQRIADLKKKSQFQFPTALVAFTPVANIPGIYNNQLVLDAPTLTGIFMGTIRNWGDPQIRALNPSLNLPDAEIKTVHRNTGNTITYALSSYLSKVSPEWQAQVGTGSKINWPLGHELDTNENLIAYVRDTPNSIGFTMLSLVIQNRLNVVRFKNSTGKVVSASPETIAAAASNARWDAADGFYNILINMPGDNTWPFVMTGYVTFSVAPDNADRVRELVDFFDSSLKTSHLQAVFADLVSLPDNVTGIIRTTLKAQLNNPSTSAVK